MYWVQSIEYKVQSIWRVEVELRARRQEGRAKSQEVRVERFLSRNSFKMTLRSVVRISDF